MRWADVRHWLEALVRWASSHLLVFDEPAGPQPNHRVTVAIGPGPPPIVVAPSESDGVDANGTSTTNGRCRLIVTPELPLEITPPRRAAWDEQGWLRKGSDSRIVYEGTYRVRRRSGTVATFRGRITVQNGAVTPYIADPPPQIKRHPKGPCFQLTQPPWFRIHWHRPATNVDDALLYVERVLDEVIN
jgi:hypothetical protein